MTLLDDGLHLADTFGVPVYYVTDVVREDAGDGNVRIWNCISRGGLLIAKCEIIVPAPRLMVIAKQATAFATDLYQRQLHAGMRH